MPLEDDLPKALTPLSPIKQGRLLTARGGMPGEQVWVEVEGSPISQRLTCATVVNSERVTVIGDRVFCASVPRTLLSRTLEYSRYRPIGAPVKNPGFVFWTDTQWLDPQLSTDVLYEIIRLFNTNTIYGLSASATGFNRVQNLLGVPAVSSALAAKNIQIKTVASIAEAVGKGLFLLDLMATFTIFSSDDFNSLRQIAQTNGLLVSGERFSWLAYNNRILRGMGIRDEVTIEVPPIEDSDFRTVGRLPSLSFLGSGNCKFVGLTASEILVKNGLDDNVFAFFDVT
ncbi:MAG: hypothetical protein KME45_03380 [Stenomitos rutilans HA7619-LM2]|jgi:hypothetical protein|nr:hypothetical protein [Stenomitos rutilans HA7619-LM2]MBW4469427.1 hypothetical protein [Stenomitos rutilans HA7619-LM2]